jgi:altronate hydrolase
MYERMTEDMDLNAGRILTEGASVEEVGREIYQRMMRVASGEATKSEAQGLGDFEFVPWQIGAVM